MIKFPRADVQYPPGYVVTFTHRCAVYRDAEVFETREKAEWRLRRLSKTKTFKDYEIKGLFLVRHYNVFRDY